MRNFVILVIMSFLSVMVLAGCPNTPITNGGDVSSQNTVTTNDTTNTNTDVSTNTNTTNTNTLTNTNNTQQVFIGTEWWQYAFILTNGSLDSSPRSTYNHTVRYGQPGIWEVDSHYLGTSLYYSNYNMYIESYHEDTNNMAFYACQTNISLTYSYYYVDRIYALYYMSNDCCVWTNEVTTSSNLCPPYDVVVTTNIGPGTPYSGFIWKKW